MKSRMKMGMKNKEWNIKYMKESKTNKKWNKKGKNMKKRMRDFGGL